MPDGPIFSNKPYNSAVQRCPLTGSSSKNWTVKDMLKIFCKQDKKIVDQLAKTTVITADSIYFEDPYFDGKKWITKKFNAGGSADPHSKTITILSGYSCESAADTFYHEIWHQNQPPGMGWPHPSEDDAYYNTELWMIKRGIPGNPDLRAKDAKGNIVPDKKAITKLVDNEYPAPPPPIAGVPQPRPIASKKATNETLVRDPVSGKTWWRSSKKGDTYAGPQKMINKSIINKSDWKCP